MARLKIYTDENVDIRIAEGLKRRGVNAFSAHGKDMTVALIMKFVLKFNYRKTHEKKGKKGM